MTEWESGQQGMPIRDLGRHSPLAKQLVEVRDQLGMREQPAEYVAVGARPTEHSAHIQTWSFPITGERSTIFCVSEVWVGSSL